MNRRNFLTALFAVPAVAAVAKVSPEQPKQKIVMSSMYGTMGNRWDILTPREITKAGFAYVNTPTFLVDDQPYCITTRKLHLWLPPERVGKPIPEEVKIEAISQINDLGFTHVYSVKFNESPVYDPINFESRGHMAFVRGFTVHWYRGSVYEQMMNRHDA